MPTPNLRRLFFASSLLLTMAGARAQLASMSPFLPPQGAHAGAALTEDSPLEFRGVAELPDGPAFRLVDPSRKTGAWVRLNQRDTDLDVLVKQRDEANDTVTVEYQGRPLTLALHQSKVASAGAPQIIVAAGLGGRGPGRGPGGPQITGTPLQQSQIDAVAAAVAARRALREQAAQQINQGIPIAPQVIQQQRGQNGANANQAGAAANPQGAQNANGNAQRGQKRQRNN